MHWYVRRRFAHAGPYTSEMVADMLCRGELTHRDRLRRDGGWTWARFHGQVDFETRLGVGRVGHGVSRPRSFALATATLQALACSVLGVAGVTAAAAAGGSVPLAAAAALFLTVVGHVAGLRGRGPGALKRRAMRRATVRTVVGLLGANVAVAASCAAFASLVGMRVAELLARGALPGLP